MYDVVAGIQVLHGCFTDVEETDKLQTLLERPVAAADDGVSVLRITLRPLPSLFHLERACRHAKRRLPDEAWNRGFAALVGRNHSSTLLQNARGQQPAKHLCSTT